MESEERVPGEQTEAQHSEQTELLSELFNFLGDWSSRYAEANGSDGETPGDCRQLVPKFAAIRPLLFESEVEKSDQLVGLWAAQTYEERRLREKVFDSPGLFGEPAWDILLDIASTEAKGGRLSTTSVCIGSCAPDTTALRWIRILERFGLLRREIDLSDKRRTFLRLTAEGARKIALYFERVSALRRGLSGAG